MGGRRRRETITRRGIQNERRSRRWIGGGERRGSWESIGGGIIINVVVREW